MQQLDQLFDAAVLAFRQRLTAAVQRMSEARDPCAFCAAEREVTGLAQQLAADMTQRVLQEVSNDPTRRVEALDRVRKAASARRIEMRVERDRVTVVRTLTGKLVEVATSYATGRPVGNGGPLEKRGRQGAGVYPILDELGISGRCTPALRMHVSRAVCEANSVTSARELLAAGGLDLDHKAALRLTYMVCDDALRARARAMASAATGQAAGEFSGRRIVATVDGGRVLIRRRVAGRPKEGGRKHFVTEWREPKILTIYVLGADGRRDRSIPSVIDGTMGDADAVFGLLRYHLRRLGAHEAEQLALIGDAAPWIWTRAQWLREQLGVPAEKFQEVIDYFHVVERLGDISKAQAGWSDEARIEWVAKQKVALKAGRIADIELAVGELQYPDDEIRTSALDYWIRNRGRLRYADFRREGLPIGSGAVESSVRRVVNLRLKSASIAWTEDHAEGVLHLRAHAKSGRWAELERSVLENTGWRPSARLTRRDG